MASDIKWIKITTDIFDDEKILLIEDMPDADAIIVIWFKLLCFAGKKANSGVFLLTDKIPYTTKMLATVFRRKEAVVQMALNTFEQLGMIEYVDDVLTIPNWGKHQNFEKIEKNREYQKSYMREYRAKQKGIIKGKDADLMGLPDNFEESCKGLRKGLRKDLREGLREGLREDLREGLRKDDVRTPDIETDREKEKEKEGDKEKIDYLTIINMYNATCVSLPRVVKLNDGRKRAIRARVNEGYTLNDFQTLFENAEGSPFLKGKNNRNWNADFDWLTDSNHMAKVIEGKYKERTSEEQTNKGGGYKTKLQMQQEDFDTTVSMFQDWIGGSNDQE